MKKIFKLLLLLILFFNCENKKTNEKNRIDMGVSIENEYKENNNTLLYQFSLLEKEINVSDIKSQLDFVATTYWFNNEIHKYRTKKNYYCIYDLIKTNDKKNHSELIGSLVIYDSINPDIYEKTTDEFVEITLDKKGIVIYNDSLRIGMMEKELIDVLGAEYDKFNETLIYSVENKKGFFKIKDSLVAKIRIGIYRDSIDVKQLLKSSNW